MGDGILVSPIKMPRHVFPGESDDYFSLGISGLHQRFFFFGSSLGFQLFCLLGFAKKRGERLGGCFVSHAWEICWITLRRGLKFAKNCEVSGGQNADLSQPEVNNFMCIYVHKIWYMSVAVFPKQKASMRWVLVLASEMDTNFPTYHWRK